MLTSVQTCRWRGGIATGKSAALRAALVDAIQADIRPIAYLPPVSDIGLRTERVDLPDRQVAAALGVASLTGRLARNLSSGERQRVRLASALAPSVRFAALDEPCRHLDPEHVQALNEILADRIAQEMKLAVCDSRSLLASDLFEKEIGAAPEDTPCTQERAAAPDGRPLVLEIPTPFSLSASGPSTGKRRVELPRSALLVVRGPNGSGKTSLLEALSRAAQRAGFRSGMSRQEPEHQVFATTPQDELEEVAAAHKDHGWGGNGLLESLALSRFLSSPSPQLPVGVLSLLGTVIALRLGRDLVLLDEPTQSLDPAATRALVAELVRCAAAGARIVVASHDPELLSAANLTWSVDAGTLDSGDAS